MKEWEQLFREESTGGFHINLSAPQMQTLTALFISVRAGKFYDAGIRSFIASGSALKRKGLVTHDSEGWHITKAGVLVMHLMQLAGIVLEEDLKFIISQVKEQQGLKISTKIV